MRTKQSNLSQISRNNPYLVCHLKNSATPPHAWLTFPMPELTKGQQCQAEDTSNPDVGLLCGLRLSSSTAI